MISRQTSFIRFSGGSNDQKAGKAKERRTTITKHTGDKEEVTPPSQGSLFSPAKDRFDANQGKRRPKFVEPEGRHQYEAPNGMLWWDDDPTTGNAPPDESIGYTSD